MPGNSSSEKPKLLFIYYNPKSAGSFVNRAIAQINHFSEDFEIFLILGEGGGPFLEVCKELPVNLIERNLTENNGLLAYIKSLFWMLSFCRKNRFQLAYIMDYIYWKPAEILALKIQRIPTVAFIAFYKENAAFGGFLSKLDLFVANSKETGRSFVEAGLGERLEVIHNFINPEDFKAKPVSWPFEESSPVIGFVGVLHPIKGIEYFIQAIPAVLEKHPSARFVIVGGEKEKGFLKKLQSLCQQLKIEKIVHFAGHSTNIPGVMASLDMLVVPSLDEPFGYINIEAGASGVPVIASRVGGIPEIIIDEETGYLVEAKNSEQISSRICKLLEKPNLRAAIGQAARKRVVENFSPEPSLKKWEKVFSRLTQN